MILKIPGSHVFLKRQIGTNHFDWGSIKPKGWGAKDKPLPLYQSASPGQTATKNRKTNQVIVFDASVPNSFLCDLPGFRICMRNHSGVLIPLSSKDIMASVHQKGLFKNKDRNYWKKGTFSFTLTKKKHVIIITYASIESKSIEGILGIRYWVLV